MVDRLFINNEDKVVGVLVKTKSFEVGDWVSNLRSWDDESPLFWRATSEDIESSNNGSVYIKLIQESHTNIFDCKV